MILSRFLTAAAVSTLLVGQALAQAQPAPTVPATPGASAPDTTAPGTRRPAANQNQQPAAPATAQPARPAAPAATAPATTQPARPAATAPTAPTTAPTTAQPARPAAPAAAAPAATGGAATAARPAQTQAGAVNLNTATQAELDGLPQIGAARAQAILAERAKGRFLNWEDFERRMAGTSLNQTAKDAIRSRIRF
ncbi:ComEA family DNA-binding protein [Phreatobacter stygius]|uniref:Helix-hairpin-helix domain-containing protein n=1 Tax=Phreatobacter stygius TaxID=1940610 RepID=A0A4D7B6Z1_9HYPH|nr:helix-hairpin-helix domain-containing protein [Phreatobacter stygius]QCI66090.1 hypothetical protein E8M01_18875 [Phreatobacter stygius]